jgi:hypothetical protein
MFSLFFFSLLFLIAAVPNVFSNNFWFSCGHSFKDSYNTDTEWLYRPVAIYFLEYIQRLQFATEFIFRNRF